MSKIIGIDLGTTNSVVAVMEGGEPVVRGLEGQPVGDGPRDQDAVPLQAQVPVQPRGVVLLDDEPVACGVVRRSELARTGGRNRVLVGNGLVGDARVALAPVALELVSHRARRSAARRSPRP